MLVYVRPSRRYARSKPFATNGISEAGFPDVQPERPGGDRFAVVETHQDLSRYGSK